MSALVARTGRHQQRYEGGHRLVSGCIPFKYTNLIENSDGTHEKVVEVLMINSTSGPGLVFPKGGWENDETVEEAAIREAVEEAGVRGDIMYYFPAFLTFESVILDSFLPATIPRFFGALLFKSKTLQDELSPEGLCKAAMFPLLVKEELQFWPEQNTRQRSWLTIPEALGLCRHQWMKEALEAFSRWYADQMLSNPKKENHCRFLSVFRVQAYPKALTATLEKQVGGANTSSTSKCTCPTNMRKKRLETS
ncbi:unnamed protein product [Prunus armeniaca]|uniref:Nudix hydrolase domain-containing protein n=1 Tax=Prunus armeniaca TaxID=36596 RepID=A0A6J5XWS6_PRUAR|nr:unnamed protein product [Prunus armeniaca]